MVIFCAMIICFAAALFLEDDISENTILNKSSSPYVLRNSIIVEENVILEIEPGVEIQICPNCGLLINGILKSSGTVSERILLTSSDISKRYKYLEIHSHEPHILKWTIFLRGDTMLRIKDLHNSNIIRNPLTLEHLEFHSGNTAIESDSSIVLNNCEFHNLYSAISISLKNDYSSISLVVNKSLFSNIFDYSVSQQSYINLGFRSLDIFNSSFYNFPDSTGGGCYGGIKMNQPSESSSIRYSKFTNIRNTIIEMLPSLSRIDEQMSTVLSEFEISNNVFDSSDVKYSGVDGLFIFRECNVKFENNQISKNKIATNLVFVDQYQNKNLSFVFSSNDLLENVLEYEGKSLLKIDGSFGNVFVSKNKFFKNSINTKSSLIEFSKLVSQPPLNNENNENKYVIVENECFGNIGRVEGGTGSRSVFIGRNIEIHDNSFVNPMFSSELVIGNRDVVLKPVNCSKNYFGYKIKNQVKLRIYDFRDDGDLQLIYFSPFLETSESSELSNYLKIHGGMCSLCFSPRKFCEFTNDEVNITYCSNHPICYPSCKNGGLCIDSNLCKCRNGWMGKDCSEFECSQKCNNRGTCVSPNKCECESGYFGDQCSEFKCQFDCHGHGLCIGMDVCDCMMGFEVPFCVKVPKVDDKTDEERRAEEKEKYNLKLTMIVVCLSIGFLCIAGIMVCLILLFIFLKVRSAMNKSGNFEKLEDEIELEEELDRDCEENIKKVSFKEAREMAGEGGEVEVVTSEEEKGENDDQKIIKDMLNKVIENEEQITKEGNKEEQSSHDESDDIIIEEN